MITLRYKACIYYTIFHILYYNISTIGKNIKRLRQEKGLSQDKLSKLADLSLNTVVKIELDDSPNPTIETVQRIAKALEVSVDDLLKK